MKAYFLLTLLFGFCGLQTIHGLPSSNSTQYCDAINLYLRTQLGHYDPISLSINDYIPLGNLNVNMFIENITITGQKELRMDCPASNTDFTESYYVCHVENADLMIDISYYNMSGYLDTVEIFGEGPAYISMENFTAAFFGPTDNEYFFLNNSVTLDLWIYRWTVNFEGIMPGTDLGYLFNEFMSMVGPETIDAIDIYINKNYQTQLTDLVNLVLNEIDDTFNIGTKPPGSLDY